MYIFYNISVCKYARRQDIVWGRGGEMNCHAVTRVTI